MVLSGARCKLPGTCADATWSSNNTERGSSVGLTGEVRGGGRGDGESAGGRKMERWETGEAGLGEAGEAEEVELAYNSSTDSRGPGEEQFEFDIF